ncbi:hypothetical protein KPH14_008730 [Odynerus spinipes]|uniref:DNA primase n=1 Tax=Odynerus spinipes TaxID=1348599 RepID=A0AAD9VIK1_9HYME|nr:hypothetical protein KPH14_008730 [Odynerus spinipes]
MDIPDKDILRYLNIYYQRLFPLKEIYSWLGYGDVITFSRREFTFKLCNQLIIRNQAFTVCNQLKACLFREFPIGIDVGAIYNISPSNKSLPKYCVERELVFDIDISDYDDIRTCCKGPDICTKCWKYIVIACKILNIYLENDFGYHHILWIFSGRRGIHCWVCDKDARTLNQCVRSGILKFMCNEKINGLNKEMQLCGRKLDYYDRRLLAIIDPEFVPVCIVDQNLLDTKEGVDYFLPLLPNDKARTDVQQLFSDHQSSMDRWNAFTSYHENMISSHAEYWQGWEEFPDYLKLHYCSPRFDVNVTEGISHLLRCPFSVHSVTGRISVPFDLAEVELFDPTTTPTLKQLVTEITTLDKNLSSEEDKRLSKDQKRMKDYEIIGFKKFIDIFQVFLEKLINTH